MLAEVVGDWFLMKYQKYNAHLRLINSTVKLFIYYSSAQHSFLELLVVYEDANSPRETSECRLPHQMNCHTERPEIASAKLFGISELEQRRLSALAYLFVKRRSLPALNFSG